MKHHNLQWSSSWVRWSVPIWSRSYRNVYLIIHSLKAALKTVTCDDTNIYNLYFDYISIKRLAPRLTASVASASVLISEIPHSNCTLVVLGDIHRIDQIRRSILIKEIVWANHKFRAISWRGGVWNVLRMRYVLHANGRPSDNIRILQRFIVFEQVIEGEWVEERILLVVVGRGVPFLGAQRVGKSVWMLAFSLWEVVIYSSCTGRDCRASGPCQACLLQKTKQRMVSSLCKTIGPWEIMQDGSAYQDMTGMLGCRFQFMLCICGSHDVTMITTVTVTVTMTVTVTVIHDV